MKTGPGAWFVQTGCFVCHSISSLGVKSPAQIGPDLSTAVEDMQKRFGADGRRLPREPDRHDVGRALAPDHPDARGEARSRSRSCARPSPSTRGRRRRARTRWRPPTAARRTGPRDSGRVARMEGCSMKLEASRPLAWSASASVALALPSSWCAPSAPKGARKARGGISDIAVAAQKTYVAPGDLDEYYMFSSGGHSGQIYVYGVPSMRHLSTIPVFTPYPATGYGFDDESKKMLGRPHLGRRAPPGALRDQRRLRRPLAVRQRDERPHRAHRPARLQDEADPRPDPERLGQPRLGLRHAEHRVRDDGVALLDPDPEGHGRRRSTSTPPTTRASSRGIKIDPKTGEMSLGWQILMPPFDYDLGDAGKKVSDGWMFFTSLQHRARHRQARGDRLAARPRLHRRRRLEGGREGRRRGQGRRCIGGVKVLDPKKVPGIVYLMPCGKSPHGVDVVARRQVRSSARASSRASRPSSTSRRSRPPSEQGLHRRRGRHPGPQVRVDQGRRGAGRPRPAAHAVRPRRLRLHLAVRRQRRSPSGSSGPGRSSTRSRCPTRSAT